MIQLELYIKEIVRFLRTVTIKNVYFRDQMLTEWVADEYQDTIPDYLHPYYRHLMGDYILNDTALATFSTATGIETDDDFKSKYGISTSTVIYGKTVSNNELYKQFDELMIINSIDTKTAVPFTRTLLSDSDHQKTASLYKIPNTYYDTICNKYPLQTDLIKAITYPISSMEDCIDAANYGLIDCDLSQLQSNEQTSMYLKVLETLAVVQQRWDVPEFTYEDLYALSIQAKIWDILILALMQQRIANIRTSSVHEYHIWEYLKSHGLDDYSDVLSIDQAVFLYTNLPWLIRRRGTEHNLILLAHKLLSDWDIVITSKSLIQQTYSTDNNTEYNTSDTCKTYPVINSTVVGKTTLAKLQAIDDKDDDPSTTYYNKTQKAQDELDAFDAESDIVDLQLGTIQTLDDIYQSEQDSGLEYTNDSLYATSTSVQTRSFTNTPHTYLPTKLLEITKDSSSTLFDQIYARFMTESLLYQVSLGNADFYLSFIPDGSDTSINVTIKEAIALVIYCSLKELGLYDEGSGLLSEAYLTKAYKSTFSPVPETYKYNNVEYKSFNVLNIQPTKITIESQTLPSTFLGEYYLVEMTADKADWVWSNNNGCTFYFDSTENSEQWILSSTELRVTNTTYISYYGWKYWSTIWISGDYVEYDVSMIVDTYNYIIDEYMPTLDTIISSYDYLIETLNQQAEGYISIYREHHGSDSPLYRAAISNVIKDRTIDDNVTVDLLGGRTFDDMITQLSDVAVILNSIAAMSEDMQSTEYAKFGNSILQQLVPIESDYITDNSGTMLNRYLKLKELFVALCSYNIAFLESNLDATTNTTAISSFITQEHAGNDYTYQVEYPVDVCDNTVCFYYTGENKYGGIEINVSLFSEDICVPYYIGDDEYTTRQYVLEDDTLTTYVIPHETEADSVNYYLDVCLQMHCANLKIE